MASEAQIALFKGVAVRVIEQDTELSGFITQGSKLHYEWLKANTIERLYMNYKDSQFACMSIEILKSSQFVQQ